MKLNTKTKKILLGIGLTTLSVATMGSVAVACTSCSSTAIDYTKGYLKPTLKVAFDALIPKLNTVMWDGNQTILPSEVTPDTVYKNLNLKPDFYLNYYNYSFSDLRPKDSSGILFVNIKITSKDNPNNYKIYPDVAIQGFLTTKEAQTVKNNFEYQIVNNDAIITGIKNPSDSIIVPKYIDKIINNRDVKYLVTKINLKTPITQKISYLALPDSISSIQTNDFTQVSIVDYYGKVTKYQIPSDITQGFAKTTRYLIHDSSNNVTCMYTYNQDEDNYQITYYKVLEGDNNSLNVQIIGGHPINKPSGLYFRMPDTFIFVNKNTTAASLFEPTNITYTSRKELYDLDIDLNTRFTTHGTDNKPLVVTNMRSIPNSDTYYPEAVTTFGKYSVLYTKDNGTYVYSAVSYEKLGYANIDQNFAVDKDGTFVINSTNFTTANGLYYPNTTRYWIGAGGTTGIPVPLYFLPLPLSAKGIQQMNSSISPLDVYPDNWIYGQTNKGSGNNMWNVYPDHTRWAYWYIPSTYKGKLSGLLGSFLASSDEGKIIVNSTNAQYISGLKTYLKTTKIKLVTDLDAQ